MSPDVEVHVVCRTYTWAKYGPSRASGQALKILVVKSQARPDLTVGPVIQIRTRRERVKSLARPDQAKTRKNESPTWSDVRAQISGSSPTRPGPGFSDQAVRVGLPMPSCSQTCSFPSYGFSSPSLTCPHTLDRRDPPKY
jgi:hypothetical protein